MPYTPEQLNRAIKEAMRVEVSAMTIEDVFPGKVRPSLAEMEVSVAALLCDEPVPRDIQLKFDAKTREEQLEEFCKKYGYKYTYLACDHKYIFTLIRGESE